jgi:hypothetical protein
VLSDREGEGEGEKEGQSFGDERLIEKDKFDFFFLPTYSLSLLHHITSIHRSQHSCCRRRRSDVDSRFIYIAHMLFT